MHKHDDAGELIPLAKKMLVSDYDRIAFPDTASECPTSTDEQFTLSFIWPEPAWHTLAENHNDVEALIRLMLIYRTLPKSPVTGWGGKHQGKPWRICYQELISKFARIDPINITCAKLDKFSSLISQVYNTPDKVHFLLAAGTVKGSTVFFPPYEPTKNLTKARVLAKLRWPFKVKEAELKKLPIELVNKKTQARSWALGVYHKKSATIEPERFTSEAEAIAVLYKQIIESRPVQTTTEDEPLYTPRRKQFSHDHAALNLPTEALIETFNFRGVQFGNSLSNPERQAFVDNTHEAFRHLAGILSMRNRWMSLGGMALAFGARGNPGAAAHFEPTLNVINLTRYNGAGCVAHEWMHGLDAKFAARAGLSGLLSDHIQHHNSYAITNLEPKSRLFVEMVRAVTALPYYSKRSAALAGQKSAHKYWTKPCELLARAFESYIQDELLRRGILCPWLVYGTTIEELENYRAEFFPYPLEAERAASNRAIEAFFKVVWTIT